MGCGDQRQALWRPYCPGTCSSLCECAPCTYPALCSLSLSVRICATRPGAPDLARVQTKGSGTNEVLEIVKTRTPPNRLLRRAGRFRERVEGALGRVRQILDSTRAPQLPANVAHRYDDKFSLAEFLSNAGLAALLNALERVGVDAGALRAMIAWAAQHRSVTLRLQCQQTCTFDRSDNRDVDASERLVRTTTSTGDSGPRELHSAEQSEVKVVTTVVEHVWNLSMQWEITVFAGTESDREQRVSLERGECSCKLVTTGERKHPPKPASREDPPLDVDLTWLLLQISNDLQLHFKIDRSAESCRTPRRNDQVKEVSARCVCVCLLLLITANGTNPA